MSIVLLSMYRTERSGFSVRSDIRNGLKDISDEFYPRVLYAGHNGPPAGGNLEDGYLKSRLLVLVRCSIALIHSRHLIPSIPDLHGNIYLAVFHRYIGEQRECR